MSVKPKKSVEKYQRLLIVAGVIAAIVVIGAALLIIRNKHNKPTVALGDYANASQIVQVLKAHNIPCNNVITETASDWWAGEGAISGVWVETAPGDSAAQWGGSADAGTDTEIVVFKNHAKAVAYVNVGSSDTPDPNHKNILGTNWAIDAASPAAASIRAVLGGTLN